MKLEEIVPASERRAAEPSQQDNTRAVLGQVLKVALSGAVSVLSASHGTGQERQERTAERAREEIVRQLLKLELDAGLQAQLLPMLQAAGARLETDSAEHPYGSLNYSFTALRGNGLDLVLLQLPADVFAADDGGGAPYLPDFANLLKAFRRRRLRLFAPGVTGLTYGFKEALRDEAREGSEFVFVNWADVQSLLKGQIKFWQAFEIARPQVGGAATPRLPVPKPLDNQQIATIVAVLVKEASNAQDSPADYFRLLVRDANWPQPWKDQKLSGWKNDATLYARGLIDFMQGKSTFPIDHPLFGQSVVGDFLRNLLATPLGSGDASDLAHILVECQLVPDAESFRRFYR